MGCQVVPAYDSVKSPTKKQIVSNDIYVIVWQLIGASFECDTNNNSIDEGMVDETYSFIKSARWR